MLQQSVKRRTVIVLATLDTKGEEAAFLRECIEAHGLRTCVIDSGVVGRPAMTADISRQEVAAAGGAQLSKLLEHAERETTAPIMAAGAKKIVCNLVEHELADGIISLGGTQGTTLSTAVMRALPYGFPKVMVSTIASGNVAPWVGIKDIVMFPSVTDILGLNAFSRTILANAAAAVCGMAEVKHSAERSEKRTVALTTVGITTTGAMEAVRVLDEAGCETIVFHAVGTGGQAMEAMIEQGFIDAVLDFSTIEVSNYMFHALLSGGASRLTTAGKLGVPQVICPGAVEVLVFNEPDTVPEPFRSRRLVRHSPQITDVRLNGAEMAEVGCEIARRLRHTTDPAVFLVPTSGYDSYAVSGEPFFDPKADERFVHELKANLPEYIEVRERPTHINDPLFAQEAANTLLELMAVHPEAKV
jgi:uncharacterized protein (UPF0261 family)